MSDCARGHAFSEDNTYLRPDGSRSCRECRRLGRHTYSAKPGVSERRREQKRAYYQRRKSAAA